MRALIPIPNALLNVVLSLVIAWMAVSNHRLTLAACSDPGSPLSDMTLALPPAISSAPGSLEMTTKEVMPTDAGSQDIQSVRPATHNSDAAPPVASGGAPVVSSRTHLRTWACTDAAGTHLCDVDTNEVLDGPEFAAWQHRTYMDAAVPFKVRVRAMYYTPPAVTKELAQKAAQAAQAQKDAQ